MRGLDVPPVRDYLLGRFNRIACEQFLDGRKRNPELTEHCDETRVFELGDVVVAIARVSVDARRCQHTEFVVEA